MKRVILMLLPCALAALGCGDDVLGTPGGMGGNGPIGPITFTPSNQTEDGPDGCDFFNPGQPDGTFDVEIDGNTAMLTHTFMDGQDTITRTASTSIYEPTDDTVILTTSRTNEEFPPCRAEIVETYTVQLDDPDASLDQNTTLRVTLEHAENDISDMAGSCVVPTWFVDLPCTSAVTFDLAQ